MPRADPSSYPQRVPLRFDAPSEFAPRSAWRRECSGCGACCSAPDIHALDKPLGVPCAHLDASCACLIYALRPTICREYQPDWVCGEVAPLPTLAARTERFLRVYGLWPPLPPVAPSQRQAGEK